MFSLQISFKFKHVNSIEIDYVILPLSFDLLTGKRGLDVVCHITLHTCKKFYMMWRQQPNFIIVLYFDCDILLCDYLLFFILIYFSMVIYYLFLCLLLSISIYFYLFFMLFYAEDDRKKEGIENVCILYSY